MNSMNSVQNVLGDNTVGEVFCLLVYVTMDNYVIEVGSIINFQHRLHDCRHRDVKQQMKIILSQLFK